CRIPCCSSVPYTARFRSQVRGFLGRSGTGATWVTTERNRKMRKAVEELAVGDRVRIPFWEQGVKSFEEFTVTSAPNGMRTRSPTDRKSTRLNSSYVKISY